MKLEIPPEPVSVKESIRRGLDVHRELEIMNLKQGTWIASPLWSDMGWGRVLKREGLSWQSFMSIIRDHFPYFLDWVLGRMDWDEVMSRLVQRLEDEIEALKKRKGESMW
ncbi:hypothetical protein DRN86_02650 [Candidatus Geothermarchaeota archaeon]|nr:MAG: hypothetical protein DRN86_02650 [Candidatus Geothermarchaeota archaeon]